MFGASMTRIFLILATTDSLFLLLSFVLGVVSKLQDGLHQAGNSVFWYHFLIALGTALLTLAVHCLIFTYFLGTGRWVKEVKLAYGLPDEPLPRLTRDLKRRVFPPALFAMLTAAFTGMVGAAAQVGAWRWEIHATLATLTLLVNFWAFVIEYRCLQINARILDDVLAEVDKRRRARGLPSNAEALQQEVEGLVH
jgi:hypothetical protein